MKCLAIASSREREDMLKAAGADQAASDFTGVSLHDLRTLFAVGEQSHAAAAGPSQP
jgi:hypothetical protein